jgi:hypothetical protein
MKQVDMQHLASQVVVSQPLGKLMTNQVNDGN